MHILWKRNEVEIFLVNSKKRGNSPSYYMKIFLIKEPSEIQSKALKSELITHKPFKNRYWSWRRNNWSGSVTIPRAAHHFRTQVLDSKTLNKKSDVIFWYIASFASEKEGPELHKVVRGTRRFLYVRIARIWKTSFFPSYFQILSLSLNSFKIRNFFSFWYRNYIRL